MLKLGKIFYGWWIAFASAGIGLFIMGTFFYGFTAFVDPIIEEFQWSYFIFSSIVSFRMVEIGIAAPLMGFLVDKFGPRRVIFVGGFVIGIGFILLSRVNSLPMFFAAFIIISIGASSCSSVVTATAIAHWFRKRVSLAMGILSAGFGLGGLLLPGIVWLINYSGWRSTLFVMGIATWVIIPTLSLVIRHKPEQYGYLPDNAIASLPVSELPQPAGEPEKSAVRTALKSRTFWFLSLAFASLHMGLNGVVLHVMPYLQNIKLTQSSAALAATFIPIVSIAGRLGFGWLGDKFNKKNVLLITIAAQVIGLLAFANAMNMWFLVIFLITFGLGYGGAYSLRPAIQRDYFGRGSFGAIQGLFVAVMTPPAFIGPAVAGWIFDVKGSYQLAWLGFAISNALAILLVLAIRAPAQKE